MPNPSIEIPPSSFSAPRRLHRLRVSDDGRRLVTAAGDPFFYLGDTAWELFQRLDCLEVELYLNDRAAKGFNVVQAVILPPINSLRTPNALGQVPLHKMDPELPNEAYFEHVDWVVEQAAARGIYMALLPTWGDKWNLKDGSGPEIFTPENAGWFGEWLGQRYRAQPVIWMLGGDRVPETGEHYSIIRSMAAGLRRGEAGEHHLISFHPRGEAGSSEYFHREPWLDFHSRQNCHGRGYAQYAKTRSDYARREVKPVIDAEPIYEDIPVDLRIEQPVYSDASDVRRAFYWDVFNGACGHAYGHHSIWQFHDGCGEGVFRPVMNWRQALDRPGAVQMGIGRRLMESRPQAGRIPDETIVGGSSHEADRPFLAVRDLHGSYAMIYVPHGDPFEVHLDAAIAAREAQAWWFNPRTGVSSAAGRHAAGATGRFQAPGNEAALDWVLVLDDAALDREAPGL